MSTSPQHTLMGSEGSDGGQDTHSADSQTAGGPTLSVQFSDGSTFTADSDTLLLALQVLLLIYLIVLERRNA